MDESRYFLLGGDLTLVVPGVLPGHPLDEQVPVGDLALQLAVLDHEPLVLDPRERADRDEVVVAQSTPGHLSNRAHE